MCPCACPSAPFTHSVFYPPPPSNTHNLPIAIIAEMESGGICTAPQLNKWDWTFHGSIFFMYTLITTVGYGFFAPKVSELNRRTTGS